MDELQPPFSHPRRSPLREWVVLGTMLAVVLFSVAVFVVIPSVRPVGFDPYPSNILVLPLALIASYGITLPFACLWANRGNWRAMLRFKWGRAISAFVFAGFCPTGLWGNTPIALGFMPAMLLGNAFSGEAPLGLTLGLQAVVIAATLLLYPLCSAVIYGLRLRWRIPAFLTTYFGAIALLFLMGFRTSGQL
jgi:hypothetical protein